MLRAQRPKPTGLDTAALEEKDAEFFKPDSPNKEVVQTTVCTNT
eukprot:COSAG06_NODE_19182_length_850_cov_0.929427_1_plen_43_part_10